MAETHETQRPGEQVSQEARAQTAADSREPQRDRDAHEKQHNKQQNGLFSPQINRAIAPTDRPLVAVTKTNNNTKMCTTSISSEPFQNRANSN